MRSQPFRLKVVVLLIILDSILFNGCCSAVPCSFCGVDGISSISPSMAGLQGEAVSDEASSTAIQLGKAWIQTERPVGLCRLNNQTCDCNWSINPTPVFDKEASATENMRDGDLAYRLHSWAGFMIWPNNTLRYVLAYDDSYEGGKKYNPVEGPWAQATLYADPLSLSFRPLKWDNAANKGHKPGMVFSMPIPAVNRGPEYPKYSSGYSSPDGKSRSLYQGGWWQSGLRVFPADDAGDTEPSWDESKFPDNLMTDRMSDWDIDLIYANKNDPSENITVTMAQGSPFAWFAYHKPKDRYVALKFYTGYPFSQSSERSHINVTEIESGVAGLGCVLVGTNQDYLFLPECGPGDVTNWNFFAVFYDKSVFKAEYHHDNGTSLSITNFDQEKDYHFVIAGLPVISYPRGEHNKGSDTNVPTEKQAFVESEDWALALAPYAYNFVTKTDITYNVDHKTGLLHTTYKAAVDKKGPIGPDSMGKTVMCLQRHHYGTFEDGRNKSVFDGDLSAKMIKPAGSGQWVNQMPKLVGGQPEYLGNNGHYQYWIAKGKLIPIGSDTFSTTYVFNNFLPFMPVIVKDAIKEGDLLWHVVNCAECDYIRKMEGDCPPLGTRLDGGAQNAGYNYGGNVRNMAARLAILKELETLAKEDPELIGDNPHDKDPFNLCDCWKGTKWKDTPPYNETAYDPEMAYEMNLEGVEKFFELYTQKTPFKTTKHWPPSDASPDYNVWHQNTPYYFLHDPVLGTIHMYPAIGPEPDYTYFPKPNLETLYPYDGFGNCVEWNDGHYLYGYLITAAAMAGFFDPAWSAKESYGEFIDQLVMSIAYDPDIRSDFYMHEGLEYSKMNFFDQWSGQPWTQGFPPSGPGGGGKYGMGSLLEDGKDDNSLGETMQAWSGVILWGSATNRQSISDLGIYLYTTNLYNADAFWFDKMLAYAPTNSKIEEPTAAKWSRNGDYIPCVSTLAMTDGYDIDDTMWDRWFNWGNPKIKNWPDVPEGYPSQTSFVPKVPQAMVQTASQFGITPMSCQFNFWFPMAGYTLAFGRDREYMELWSRSIDQAPSGGWSELVDPAGKTYRTTVNQQRALSGVKSVVQNTTAEPYDWFWNVLQENKDYTDTHVYGLNWWNAVRDDYIHDELSISEALNWFWALDKYGTPDFGHFGYSKEADQKGLSQPFTAVFSNLKTGQKTFVAWNPHDSDLAVNWWKVGEDASATAGQLAVDLTVPGQWFALITIPASPDASLKVMVTADPQDAKPKTDVTFTISVTNTGKTPISSVNLIDYLPDEMSYVSGGTQEGDKVAWSLGDMDPGKVTQRTLVAQINSNIKGTIYDFVKAEGLSGHKYTVEDYNYTTVTSSVGKNLAVTVSTVSRKIVEGKSATFLINVNNTGGYDFLTKDGYGPVKIFNQLPDGLKPMGSSGWINMGANTYSKSIGDLKVGESKTVKLKVDIPLGAIGKKQDFAWALYAWPGGSYTSSHAEKDFEIVSKG